MGPSHQILMWGAAFVAVQSILDNVLGTNMIPCIAVCYVLSVWDTAYR